MSSTFPITLRDLTYEWPNGTLALDGLTGTFSSARTGLVGRNGAGKSTLLRLIAGELTPTSGHVDTVGEVGYLAQTVAHNRDLPVAEILGVGHILAALRAVESGDVDEKHFDAIGDDWDIEARTVEALAEIGFAADYLDRTVGEISGGEAMLLAITGLRVRRTPVTLLDEPTNNLDRDARAKLGALVDSWAGTLVVVSHDLELLERMDATAEIHAGQLDVFGGPYSEWREHLTVEQEAATQAARSAQQALKVEKRQRQEAEAKLAQRARTGKKTQRDGGLPKILVNARINRAEGSAGAMRTTLDSKVQTAQAAVDAADARVREEEHIHLTLPDPDVPKGRRIAQFTDGKRTVIVQGPERVALVGPNGSGKTTLLEALVSSDDEAKDARGELFTDRVGYLAQRLDGLDDSVSAIANVQPVAPELSQGDIRNQLARLLIRGGSVDRPVGSLSGGERFRVALAKILLAQPPAQLLVLDEPTNNLDIASVEQLAEALDSYRGALLIVSHDNAFLRRLGIDVVLTLDPDGGMHLGGELPT